MIYRTVLCLWLVLFLFPGGVLAQVFTDRKVRTFKASEKTTVEVVNKYGKIHVVPWDKDSVRFEVDLRISANNQEKMEKMRSNISFDFTSTRSYIVGKTNFANQTAIISDFVDAFIPSNQVTINYMVFIPRNISMRIENKFGDIYMDDFRGNLEIELSNGDLKANRLSGSPTLKLSSADGVVNYIDDGKVIVAYSDLEIKEAGDVQFESKSSNIIVDKAIDVDIDSKRDKYEISVVSKLKADGNFTTINIEDLSSELIANLKYGDLEVLKVHDKFSFINIISEYTDIDLYFLNNTSYNLDITHNRDVYINLPARLARIETKTIDEDEKTMLTYGQIGSAASTTSHKVNITALKKCYINIIHR